MATLLRHVSLAAFAVFLLASCAPGTMGCGFTEQTYAQLRVGMTPTQVASMVGCRGATIVNSTGSTGQFLMVRYAGPSGEETTLTFQNGRLDNFTRSPGAYVRVGR